MRTASSAGWAPEGRPRAAIDAAILKNHTSKVDSVPLRRSSLLPPTGMPTIDLNADLGERSDPESLGDDAAILDVVTSANIACAFHAGDPQTMRTVCEAAVARGVRIGAHVGYDDRPGFGRRPIDVRPTRLRDETIYQLGALTACAAAAGGRLAYVKPHGALYTRCVEDQRSAAAIAAAAAAVDSSLAILGPPGSLLLAAAAARSLTQVAEGFADRAYFADGSLLPRSQAGSVLSLPDALAQAERIALAQQAIAADGSLISLNVGSLCLHGDTPRAAALARLLRDRLERSGVEIRPFA